MSIFLQSKLDITESEFLADTTADNLKELPLAADG